MWRKLTKVEDSNAKYI